MTFLSAVFLSALFLGLSYSIFGLVFKFDSFEPVFLFENLSFELFNSFLTYMFSIDSIYGPFVILRYITVVVVMIAFGIRFCFSSGSRKPAAPSSNPDTVGKGKSVLHNGKKAVVVAVDKGHLSGKIKYCDDGSSVDVKFVDVTVLNDTPCCKACSSKSSSIFATCKSIFLPWFNLLFLTVKTLCTYIRACYFTPCSHLLIT